MASREWEHPTMGTGRRFSRALEAPAGGRHVYFAGQAPNDESGSTVQGGIVEQAEACFGKLKALVEAAGGSMADFVMLNTYVTDAKSCATPDRCASAISRIRPTRPRAASRCWRSPTRTG